MPWLARNVSHEDSYQKARAYVSYVTRARINRHEPLEVISRLLEVIIILLEVISRLVEMVAGYTTRESVMPMTGFTLSLVYARHEHCLTGASPE